jgi:histidine phosphotransferase ChpT
VARSAETAAARLRFLRIAFGPVLGPSALSAIEFGGIAAAYFAPTRATLHWPARPVDPPGGTKLAALVLLLAEEAVPLGGTVRVACEAGRLEVRTVPVRGGGLRPEVEAALDGRWADGSARAAPGYLAYRVARANGIDLRHADTSDGLVITARTGHVP